MSSPSKTLPTRKANDDDDYGVLMCGSGKEESLDSFLSRCLDFEKDKSSLDFRSSSPILCDDTEVTGLPMDLVSPGVTNGDCMMLLMMQEARSTSPSLITAEDLDGFLIPEYLPRLNVSLSMEYEKKSEPSSAESSSQDLLDNTSNESVSSCRTMCHGPMYDSEEELRQLEALSLASKSMDTALEAYNVLKTKIQLNVGSLDAKDGTARTRAPRNNTTQMICQQAMKRANNTTVLSNAFIEGTKEKEREKERQQAAKAAALEAKKARIHANSLLSTPKQTKSPSLLQAAVLRTRSHDTSDTPSKSPPTTPSKTPVGTPSTRRMSTPASSAKSGATQSLPLSVPSEDTLGSSSMDDNHSIDSKVRSLSCERAHTPISPCTVAVASPGVSHASLSKRPLSAGIAATRLPVAKRDTPSKTIASISTTASKMSLGQKKPSGSCLSGVSSARRAVLKA